MSSESLRESLSALMDNEADELEVRRVLKACGDDSSLRSDWARYQAARASMHKEPWHSNVDLSAGIAAAIVNDPAPTLVEAKIPAKASRVWQSVGRLAVAASVTVAVLVGVNMFNQDGGSGSPAMVADQPPPVTLPNAPTAQPGAVLAGFSQDDESKPESQPAPEAWQEERIGDYLRHHTGQSAGQITPKILPAAGVASQEGQ